MKLKLTDILLIILILVFGYNTLFNKVEPQVIKVEIPEIKGTTDTVYLDKIRVVEVDKPYPVKGETKIIVDQKYKELYEKAIKENDSLKQYALFLEVIKINDKKIELVNNDTIQASIFTKTRGELLSYKFDWKLKKRYIDQKIEPKSKLILGAELGIPYNTSTSFALKANIGYMDKRNNIFTISPDTSGNIWLGYSTYFDLW